MSAAVTIFTSYQTWIALGATCQLSMVAWVRQPKGWLAALPPAAMLVGIAAAYPSSGGWSGAYAFGVGFGTVAAAMGIAASAPARMDSGILLGITTAFWLTLGPSLADHVVWAALAAAPSLLVLLGAASAISIRPELKLALYVWALAALTALGTLNFPRIDFADLSQPGREWVMILAASWLGAHLAMLVQNAGSLLVLLPIPSRDMPWETALQRSRDFARLLIANYAENPLSRAKAFVVVGAQLALFAASRSWSPVSRNLALQACLSLALFASIVEVGPSVSYEDLAAEPGVEARAGRPRGRSSDSRSRR